MYEQKIVDEEHAKEMIKTRKPGEPVDAVFPIFCQRYGVTMENCRSLYDEITAKGEIKEK